MKKLLLFLFALVFLVVLAVVTAGVGLNISAHARQSVVRTAAAPQNGRYLPAGDCEIYVQEAGPATGPVLLFVGGTGAWSENWKSELAIAGAEGFHAVAIDLPPFGYSMKPENDDYTRTAQAKRIGKLLESLNAASAAIVGHSFGAAPVITAAAEAPGQIKALLLVDPALGWPPEGSTVQDAPAYVRLVLDVVPVRLALAGIVTHPALQKALLQRVLYRKDMATEEKVAIFSRQMNVQGKSEEMSKWLADFLTIKDTGIVENPDFFKAVNAKTTILWGDHDDITPLWQGEKLAKLLPGSTLTQLKGVGHVPQIEDPPAFQLAFKAFAKETYALMAPPAAPAPVLPAPPASATPPVSAPRSAAPPAPGTGGGASATPARPSG